MFLGRRPPRHHCEARGADNLPFACATALAEIATLDAVKHPNVVELLGAFHDEAGTHAVLAYWPVTLQHYMHWLEGPMQGTSSMPPMRDILDGLGHIHRLNIVYNELCPTNILVNTGATKACLADFVAAFVDSPAFHRQRSLDDMQTYCREPTLLPYRAPHPQLPAHVPAGLGGAASAALPDPGAARRDRRPQRGGAGVQLLGLHPRDQAFRGG